MRRVPSFLAVAALLLPTLALAQLEVVSTAPTINAVVATSATVAVTFDRALNTSTVTSDTFRVFGRWSGTAAGTLAFSNGNKTVTLTPTRGFTAGEFVYVNLSHDITAADTTTLRDEGYAFQFTTGVTPSAGVFTQIDQFTNKTGPQTRIYGASGGDLNEDGYPDLATVNEVSADIRVFLNEADGSGLYGAMLPRHPIGVEASPNETADFDNDGHIDLCIGAASSDDVWIVLGAGNGTFSSTQDVEINDEPHGVAPIDVDGDADMDILVAAVGSNDMQLLINDGDGNFGAPTDFEAGVNGEYAIAIADMNNDGISDAVVGGRNVGQIVTLLGNGDGTFTAAGTAQSTGGNTWVVVLGDFDEDGQLDAATANDGSGTIGILLGNGDGTFDPVTTINIGWHVPSVDAGDLDGDGHLDLVVSSYGGSFWESYRGDGNGGFSSEQLFPAPANPSCAVLIDMDRDGDLDMALTDEIADNITLMLNEGAAVSSCAPAPENCRQPIEAGKSKLLIKDKSVDIADGLTWKWTKGATTPKADYGHPPTTDGYELCVYEDGVLAFGMAAPAAGSCNGKPCWKESTKGFSYSDKLTTPDGILSLKMNEGTTPGKASISLKGKGEHLDLPDPSGLTGTLDVQLQRIGGGGPCFGARFSPPFQKNAGGLLKDISDAPPATTTSTSTSTSTSSTTTSTLAPTWAAIQTYLAPRCGCHGAAAAAGLGGLNDCNAGHAALVNVASTELTSMDRVEPGDPTSSWIMHKLDGTHGTFSASCVSMFCGQQMPLGGPYFSVSVRDSIRAWITNGAVNDCP